MCWSARPTGSNSAARSKTRSTPVTNSNWPPPDNSQVRARIEDEMIRPRTASRRSTGRGINSAGDVIRFAVGRADGKASMDDLDAQGAETVEGFRSAMPPNARLRGRGCCRPGSRRPRCPPRPPVDACARAGVRGRDLAAHGGRLRHRTPPRCLRRRSPRQIDLPSPSVVANIVAGRQSPNEAIIIFFDPKRRSGEVTRLLVEPNPDDENPADFTRPTST